MPLPSLTHLQFAVLDSLRDEEMSGQELRKRIAKHSKMRLPAFYRLMSRLEKAKFVKGWYVQSEVGGQVIRERTYKLTGTGERACESAALLYLGSRTATEVG